MILYYWVSSLLLVSTFLPIHISYGGPTEIRMFILFVCSCYLGESWCEYGGMGEGIAPIPPNNIINSMVVCMYFIIVCLYYECYQSPWIPLHSSLCLLVLVCFHNLILSLSPPSRETLAVSLWLWFLFVLCFYYDI